MSIILRWLRRSFGPELESEVHDHDGVDRYHLDPTGRTIGTNRAVFVKLQYLFRY